MLRLSYYGLRNLARSHVRFYRKRRLVGSSHIPTMRTKDLRQDHKVVNVNAHSPEDVEKNLKTMGFQELDPLDSVEDIMLKYLKHTNSGFKRSSKNLNKLQQALSGQNKDEDTRLSILFDYLLEESELEIKRLAATGLTKVSPQKTIKEEQTNPSIENEKDLENAIFTDLFNTVDEDGKCYLTNTDFVYQILTDLNNRKNSASSNILSIEQMVQAFELAKLVPIEGRRKRGIFLAGNLIYSLGTVRMDPVNESFYIESLVNYGLYRKAYKLFESNKENVNEKWWYEMGMMIVLRANYLQKFDKLLSATDLRFHQQPYVSPKVLKLAIKKKLFLRDFEAANRLTDRFVDIVNKYGCKNFDEVIDEKQRIVTFKSELQADEFLNEIELPTDYDFITIIEYHLFRKNVTSAFKLMACYLEAPRNTKKNYQFLIVQMRLHLLKEFASLGESLKPHISPEVADQRLHDLEESFNTVVEEYHVNPSSCKELLFDSVASLVSNRVLTKTVENFVVGSTATSRESEETVFASKKFHGLIKLLLASGRENDAFKLLSKMEEAYKNAEEAPELSGKQFYAEVNAHHYAEFIEYFTLIAMKGSKKQIKNYETSVSEILERMKILNIPYNAVFQTRLLIFYRESNNFEKSFSLINKTLEAKDTDDFLAETDRTRLYNRRDITRPLYVEIWKTYSKYYKIFSKELERAEKKSNYIGWKMNVANIIKGTNVHPQFSARTIFRNMHHLDNVLPDHRMYYIILLTFMRRRDWAAIPAILSSMAELHGLSIPDNFVNYLMKGLEREFIIVQSKNQEAIGLDSEDARMKAKKSMQQLKKAGCFLKPQAGKPETADKLIEQVLMLLKFKSSGDYDFSDVKNAMREMESGKVNLQELIENVHSKN